MELILILRVLLRRWYAVVIPVVVVAVFAVPELLAPPQGISGGFTTVIRYSGSQVLDAIPERDGDYQDVWLASELAINAFTDWIQSSSFAEAVSARLDTRDLDIPAEQLAFASNNERSVGQIFVSWGDAEQLQQIAEAALDVLQNETAEYFPQLGGVPAEITLLDSIRIVPQPAPITSRFAPLLKLAVALFGGIALAFIVEYLDPFVYRREQLEAMNVRVVGSVPRK